MILYKKKHPRNTSQYQINYKDINIGNNANKRSLSKKTIRTPYGSTTSVTKKEEGGKMNKYTEGFTTKQPKNNFKKLKKKRKPMEHLSFVRETKKFN